MGDNTGSNYLDFLKYQEENNQLYRQNSLDLQKQNAEANATNGKIGLGISIGKDLLGAYMQYTALKQQKKQFEFSKEIANKNFALAKDAYDRKVRKSDYIAEAIANGKK